MQSAPRWDDLIGKVFDLLKFDLRRSPTLMNTIDRGVRYVEVDPSPRQITFDAKALVLGFIAAGRNDLDSVRFGNSATWFYEWFKGKVSDDRLGRVLDRLKTDPDQIFPIYEGGGTVRISGEVAALVPVATEISLALSGRPELEARHFFTAMVQEGVLGRQLLELFEFDIANSLDELKHNLIERMLTQPDTGETLPKWLKAFSIPESQSARFTQEGQGGTTEIGGLENTGADASASQTLSGSRGQPSGGGDLATPPVSSTINHRRISHAVLGNDSSEDTSLDDQLGIKDEALAFARIAAARETAPPLAFGVFGEWGSGKSFFMRLMQKYVEDLSQTEGKKQESLFYGEIVQIRFNAWHYVETNLWASLVEHIFAELDGWSRRNATNSDQLLGTLVTARELTLQAAQRLVAQRRKQKSAAERLAAAERELAIRREQAGGTPRAFWTAVKDSFTAQIGAKQLQGAADELGISALADNVEALRDVLNDVGNERKRAAVLSKGLWARLRKKPSLLILLAIIIFSPIAFYYLNASLFAGPALGWLADYIKGWMAAGTGLLVSVTAFLTVIKARVRSGLAALEGYRAQLDKTIESQLLQPKQEVKLEEEKLAQLTADIAEAKAVLVANSAQLAEAMHNYESDGSRQRLLRFVRERAGADGYGKHLGLIHSIRKDFTQLSALMSTVDSDVEADIMKQRADYTQRLIALLASAGDDVLKNDERQSLEKLAKPPETEDAEKFDRIVLYVDDLDRCPPQQVVQVLQAVHLLLSFPLFFVVVAVDTRWVVQALDSHYDGLLDDRSTGSASSSDYLEKIFQIPYWVRSMSVESSQSFVRSLLQPRPPKVTKPANGDTPGKEVATRTPTQETTLGAARQLGDARLPASNEIKAVALEATSPTRTAGEVAYQALTLTHQEQAFMQKIARWTGDTPRRALRFVNTYRVIKACLAGDQLQRLEVSDYRLLMVQLAIVIGTPDCTTRWSRLITDSAPEASIAEMIKGEAGGASSASIGAMLDEVARETGEQTVTVGDFRRYWEIASRYGFTNSRPTGSLVDRTEKTEKE